MKSTTNRFYVLIHQVGIALAPPLLFIFFSIFLASCSLENADFEGFDKTTWKNDKGGCQTKRAALLEALKEKVAPKLKGFTEQQTIAVLGRPDRSELYERHQKFFFYYVESGEHCRQADKNTQARFVRLRFDALGKLNEISF